MADTLCNVNTNVLCQILNLMRIANQTRYSALD